ncbi:DUF1492 domain-containing protein [Bacillus cereus group sp. BY112LC]|uniref:DUF1492 domain-containing protein n=1 Tax=Bacillus cereus group TaxID=86661 RepID=UPI000BF0B8C2|nr:MULTISPECIES: DUF1492 domain-containing protein [Bacillus cereus group]MED2985543.1 DUF1492 domain-containing protein [Bacillus thuringiensis]MDA1874313.1 DUF1492 domain-containing protein [Bacillus cereus group sp. BY112LC]MRB61542.1 DUF1492 domain-containing protein [Bacillus thuringiensis]PEM89484.1 hypothetical protein CN629_21755 [Bacillus toyonensis]PHA89474.1 hypothetical protein COE74_09600 [Bacillus toyonensis]
MFRWLKDYQKLEEEIAYLEYDLEQTEAELKRWISGDLCDVRLTPDSQGAKVEEIIEKKKGELYMKQEQRRNLVHLISKFKGLENQILKRKYIDGMTLEEVAENMNYSSSYIYKKHAEIIKRIKFAEELAL